MKTTHIYFLDTKARNKEYSIYIQGDKKGISGVIYVILTRDLGGCIQFEVGRIFLTLKVF